MEDRQDHLRDHMLGRDEIDIVHAPHILQFHVPFGKLFRSQVEPIPLMRNLMILTEDTPQVTAGEED